VTTLEEIDALASELEVQAHNEGVECESGGPHEATPKAARKALLAAVAAALLAAEQRGAREERERCARLAEAEAAEYDSNARACDASGNHLGGTLDTASGMACRYVATALRAAPSPGEEPR
jgi:hypothetical protein